MVCYFHFEMPLTCYCLAKKKPLGMDLVSLLSGSLQCWMNKFLFFSFLFFVGSSLFGSSFGFSSNFCHFRLRSSRFRNFFCSRFGCFRSRSRFFYYLRCFGCCFYFFCFRSFIRRRCVLRGHSGGYSCFPLRFSG